MQLKGQRHLHFLIHYILGVQKMLMLSQLDNKLLVANMGHIFTSNNIYDTQNTDMLDHNCH